MKYLRKIIWLVIGVVFLASVIIGTGVIFAVKNVNVTLHSYAWSEWDDLTEEDQELALEEVESIKNMVLESYGGKLISFVNFDDLASRFNETSFNDKNYILESCEKAYPCTLNITVKERREVFIIADGNGKYSTYDSLGTLMRNGIDAEYAEGNNIDSAPNIYVSGVASSEDIVKVAEAASIFSEKFSSLRSIVELIFLNTRSNSIIFKLRCGSEIYITDFTVSTDAKIEAAYDKFMTLTGEEKLSGGVMGYVIGESQVVAAERFKNSLLTEFSDEIYKDFPDIVL